MVLDTAQYPRKPLYAWALYDWANSAFATVVLAGFFPILYRDYFSIGREDSEITLSLGLINSLGALFLVLFGPFSGALSDVTGRRKLPLALCIVLGVFMTMGLSWIDQGEWQLASMVYVIATLAFVLGNVFYDALLVQVSAPRQRVFASTLGFALGYLGGGLLLAILVYLIYEASRFGFASAHETMLFGFIATALWWLIFSLPLLTVVRDSRSKGRFREGWQRLIGTWEEVRKRPVIWWFLIAYLLYMDGVETIIRMAVNYGQVLGLSPADLISALLLVQIIGFPATLIYSWLARYFSIRALLLFLIGAYVGICVAAVYIETLTHFLMVATAIGCFQGGIQALSRAYFSQIIPRADAARYFGFYNLISKAAVLLGPATVGVVGIWSGSPRIGILSITVFLVLGGVVLLWKVGRYQPVGEG